MRTFLDQARNILKGYTGYPDLPTGRPCGVLAYMFGHGKHTIDVSCPITPYKKHRIEVPYRDDKSACRPEPYYAMIETNPTGVWVATVAKGSQDLLAANNEQSARYELGQPRDLRRYLKDFDVILSHLNGKTDDINDLHLQLIEQLLAKKFSVRLETAFEAAVRETHEEHGFKLDRKNVQSIDYVVEKALSKRSIVLPIDHHLIIAEVRNFNNTVVKSSTIVEEKNSSRLGEIYEERGVYLNLKDLHDRFIEAQETSLSFKSDDVESEIISTRSKVMMMKRIEERILARDVP